MLNVPVSLAPLSSRDKQWLLKPGFRQNVTYVLSFHKTSSLSRLIIIGTLQDHYSDPHISSSSVPLAPLFCGLNNRV